MLMSYKVNYYSFGDFHPRSDSCWSISTGPDGRVYAAACCETVPGGTVKLCRYNEKTDKLDFLFDLAEMVDDPPESGRASQCKIHYSFVPSMHDGILYMATHLSAPAKDTDAYLPWADWHSPHCFRGAALVAYDTKKDKVAWWDTIMPQEGCRCLAIDEERGLLYSMSYPRDHMYVYDIEKRTKKDLGRVSSVNPQTIFVDGKHRVWTTNDDGHLVKYDPAKGRLEVAPMPLPHDPYLQDGWHNVFYDVAKDPKAPAYYSSSWVARPMLLRFWPEEGDWGRVESLGRATQDHDPSFAQDYCRDHCGGLVFGGDGMLYYVAGRWRDPNFPPSKDNTRQEQGLLWRMDPKTGEREIVTTLDRPDSVSHYVSRGAINAEGDLFFAHCAGFAPVGVFKVEMPDERKKPNAHLPIRTWG